MAYVPIRSKEQACNLVDPKEQVSLLAEIRDELYDGRWNPMIRDMKRWVKTSPNPAAKYVLERDLELIANAQSTE